MGEASLKQNFCGLEANSECKGLYIHQLGGWEGNIWKWRRQWFMSELEEVILSHVIKKNVEDRWEGYDLHCKEGIDECKKQTFMFLWSIIPAPPKVQGSNDRRQT